MNKPTSRAYLEAKLAALAVPETPDEKEAKRVRFQQLLKEQAERRAEVERTGHH